MDNGHGDLLLEVKGLKTYFFLDEGTVKAVDGVDFEVRRGQTVCVVGESGCGKSVTALSILQLVDPPGRIVEGEILLHRQQGDNASVRGVTNVLNLAAMNPRSREIRDIRGKEISMIFQEPMTSLSPVHRVGAQISEAIQLHMDVGQKETRAYAVELLRRVGIPNPNRRIDSYRFELSGGMRQRVMIAIALSCNPNLLIADEPTTALDVTTQAQILDLIYELQQDLGTAVVLITHDLGVVAETADDVVVMYLGTVVERGDVDSIFHDPKHPYTRALLRSIPKLGTEVRGELGSIRGMVPDPYNRPIGCSFHPRCDEMIPGVCDHTAPQPVVLKDGRVVRCLLYGEGNGV